MIPSIPKRGVFLFLRVILSLTPQTLPPAIPHRGSGCTDRPEMTAETRPQLNQRTTNTNHTPKKNPGNGATL